MLTAPPPGSVPFGDLLDALRRQGFPIGLDHYVRLQALLEVAGPDCEPDRLKTLLCPICATSREQQEQFYRTFDQYYPMFAPAPARVGGPAREADEIMPPAAASPGARFGRYALAGVGAALLLVAIGWWGFGREPRADGVGRAPAGPADSAAVTVGPAPTPVAVPAAAESATGQATPPGPTPESPAAQARAERETAQAGEPFLVRHAALLRVLAVLLPLLVFLVDEWRRYRSRRLVIQRQRREKPPFVWPIRVPRPGNPFEDSPELQFAARLLRTREEGEVARLSVEASVTATIEARGFPTLRFRTDTRPPDYLILIERSAFRDHRARFFNDLGRALEREGVHAARYYYDHDPRVCHPESGGDRMLLVDLRRRYPTHRLLVFGNGEAFIDPIGGRLHPWTQEFLSWGDRALFTPEAPRGWGQREVTLARHFILLPATMQGLLAVVEHFRAPIRPNLRAWRARSSEPPPPAAIGQELRELRAYLGEPAFRWLTACAVYPELHWDLTLHLGRLAAMPAGLISEANLLRLLALPWFRAGALPDEIRVALLAELDPVAERAVRSAIVALLESDPAPDDSVAGNQYDLELVVQRFALNRADRKRRRELTDQVRALPERRVMEDLAVLQLLERAPSSRLAMMLPRRLRNVFFQDGIAVLGLRAGARAGVALFAIAGLLLALKVSEPPRPSDGLRFASPWMDTTTGAVSLVPGEVARFEVARSAGGVFSNVKGVQWSLAEPGVAAIDTAGTITALRVGVTAAHGVAPDGGEVDVMVRVDSARFEVALSPPGDQPLDSLTLPLGDARPLSLLVPAQGRRLIQAEGIRWGVRDSSVLRIDASGATQPVAVGRTEAIARAFGVEARIPVTVTAAATATAVAVPPRVGADSAPATTPTSPGTTGAPVSLPVAAIRVAPESLILVAGMSRPLTVSAQAFDRTGTVLPSAAFTYQLSGQPGQRGLVQLASDGAIIALGDTGFTTLLVSSGQVTTRVAVRVRAPRLVRTELELEPSRLSLRLGERSRIVPHFFAVDEAGRRTPSAPSARWRVEDPSVATIDPDGTVSPVAVGRTTISAGDSARFLGVVLVEVLPAAAAAPPAPAELVLDAEALTAIAARVDAAIGLIGAGRITDPALNLVYPGADAAALQRARNQLATFFRDTDFKPRPATKGAPTVNGQQVEVEVQLPFEWHDSFGRTRRQAAVFRAVLTRAGSEWQLREIRLLRGFPS